MIVRLFHTNLDVYRQPAAVRWVRGLLLTLAASVLLSTRSFAAEDLSSVVKFDIPAQPVQSALFKFSELTNIQVVVSAQILEGKQSQAVSGTLPVRKALDLLLGGTELNFAEINPRTVAIRGPKSRIETSSSGDGQEVADGSLQLARADTSAATDAARSEASSGNLNEGVKSNDVQEIIVTAQKRAERLQDVPVPVTALNAETLLEKNMVGLQEYYTKIPGFNVTPDFQSRTVLSIRGLTTGRGNPTVGITIDDVPYGSSTDAGGGNVIPDIDPADLARVEVLRGPQGTLYGVSSMGGLLKFVTVDPSTEGVSGRVQAGATSVRNGAELGYNARGLINIPLSDTWAIRASGFTRHEAGYIDDPSRGIDGANEREVYGGRVSALWRASDSVSLKLSALYQRIEGDSPSQVDRRPGLSDLQQSRLLGTGNYDTKIQAYSAALTAKLGRVDFTSLTGYNINRDFNSIDGTLLYAALAQPLFGFPGTDVRTDWDNTKFTQEFRFSVPVGERIEWLFGAFYTDEDAETVQRLPVVNPATGAQVGLLRGNNQPSTYREYAAFTDFTFRFTDRFDVQVGGRESRIKQTYAIIQIGPTAPASVPKTEAQASPFTYLLTPRFKLSEDLMVYARMASGYRAGGTNTNAGLAGIPQQYDPDKTRTYEIGAKGSLFNRLLTFDASVYYIDWTDIQLNVLHPVVRQTYTANVGHAKSQGVELSVESRPLEGLRLAAWAAWNDAELTESFPSTSSLRGPAGSALPYNSRISGNVSVDQEFVLTSRLNGFVGGSVSYVDDRRGPFTATLVREPLPSYTRVDLNAGVKSGSWSADIFVTNLTDERGLLFGGLGTSIPSVYAYIQPRTVGVSFSKNFD